MATVIKDELPLEIDDGDDEIIVPITELVQTLQEALAVCPEEFREKAVVKIRASGGDYAYAYVTAYYERPETDDERRAREQHAARRQTEHEARRRAYSARSRAKFEAT